MSQTLNKYRTFGNNVKLISSSSSSSSKRFFTGAHGGLEQRRATTGFWNIKDSLELKGHTGDISQLAWDPVHADLLATACTDKSIRIWDVRTAKSTTIPTSGENINVTWSPDGKFIAVGNKEDTVSFIDPRGGADAKQKTYVKQSLRYDGVEINEITWNHGGDLFFMTTGQGKIKILDFPDLKPAYEFVAHTANCYCIEFDPKGRYFATGGADAIVCLWDMDDFVCVRTYGQLEWPVRTISFSSDGELIASGSEDNFIDVSAVETGELIHTLQCDAAMNSVAWHPHKQLLAYAGDDVEHNGNYKGNLHVFGFPSTSS
ncbi:hypothetical protein HDV00_006810 [Rhizophlyctis rosea]|nr:hypothetical protein HDV00_006810 [Rhizophlyctis rosea]